MLSFGAMRTEVVGTPDHNSTDYREEGFAAQFLEACGVTARTRNCQVLSIGLFELQQLRQGCSPGPGASRYGSLSRHSPDRACPSSCGRGKRRAEVALLRGRLPAGSFAPFFFLVRLPGLFHWT